MTVTSLTAAKHTADDFADQLLTQHDALRRLICARLRSNDPGNCAVRDFEAARAHVAARRGMLAMSQWQYGIALNMARALGADQRYADARCVLGLSDELRQALWLTARGELSIDTAALLAALPLEQVRLRLARAISR